MIDSHCHIAITFSNEERIKVMKTFADNGGQYVVDVATNIDDLEKVSDFVRDYKIAYAVAGLHPEEIDESNVNDSFSDFFEKLEATIKSNQKIIGIGETGLDYSRNPSDAIIQKQKELFLKHLQISEQLSLPLVIHARGKDFDDDTPYIEILKIVEQENYRRKIYFHSYAGSLDLAKTIIDKGYLIGINGICTYSNAEKLASIIEAFPIESFLLETDSPYLIPSNMDRSILLDKKRNEPCAIFYISKRIEKLKKIALQQILDVTTKSALNFFERIL